MTITRREFIKQALAAGAALPFFLSSCQQAGEGAKAREKAIFLGIDGLDHAMMSDMIRAGALPNFASLADLGVFSRLQTSNPAQSPVAWSSMATGNNPGKHGLFDFLIRNPKNYLPELSIIRPQNTPLPYPSFVNPRKSPAFWEILADGGIAATVLKWPVTFPPSKSAATVLSGLGVPDITGGLGTYTYYTTRSPSVTEEGREKVIPIRFIDNRADTKIYGPIVKGIAGRKKAAVPLTIKLDRARQGAILSLQGKEYRLREKAWSPWVNIEFQVGMLKKVSAICRFHLNSLKAPFALYLSPFQIDPADPCFPISQPGSYAPFLQQELGYFHTLGIPEDTKALTENRISEQTFIDLCDTIIDEQEAMLWQEIERFKHGLFAFVFFTIDRIQHIFWSTKDPQHPAYDKAYAARYRSVIWRYYQRMDKILGKLLQKMDPNTLLLVCSDHGFTSFRRAVHLNSWLVKNGLMTLHTRPLSADRDGGPLFAYVDWTRTSAYALGLNGLYLNLAGREAKGIVLPSQYEAKVQQIKQKLEDFCDPDSGAKVIKTAYPAKEIYSGEHTAKAPDLVIGFNDGYRMSWQSAIGGTPQSVLEDNTEKWTGDHCLDPSIVPGVLFSNKKLRTEQCRGIDIAPTILDYFSIPNYGMDGRSML